MQTLYKAFIVVLPVIGIFSIIALYLELRLKREKKTHQAILADIARLQELLQEPYFVRIWQVPERFKGHWQTWFDVNTIVTTSEFSEFYDNLPHSEMIVLSQKIVENQKKRVLSTHD
jgi:hypothetical protein